MYYTLAVSDIDGTLVDKNKKIPGLNREVIRAFQQKGGFFSLATGRIEKSAIPYCRELGISCPVILYNGARIVDPINERVLFERQLSLADFYRAIELYEKFDYDYIIYSEGEAFIFRHSEAISDFEKGDGYSCRIVSGPDELWGRSINKVLMIGDPASFPSFRTAFAAGREEPADLIQSEWNYLEILPRGVNKGAALGELGAILGIPAEKTICFGDNSNDIEMIRRAGRGVAMENAVEELKAAADLIAPPHDEAGVGLSLAQLCGISLPPGKVLNINTGAMN